MALLFDDAAAEHLQRGDLLGITGYPFTFAARIFPDATGAIAGIMAQTRTATTDQHMTLRINASNQIEVHRSSSTASQATATSGTISINTWHHAAGTFASATDMRPFLDGTVGTTGTTSVLWSLGDTPETRVGQRADTTATFSGRIAEVGVWNVALTTAEIQALAKGFSPLLIRPQSLVAYWPLIRNSVNQDAGVTTLDRWKNRFHLTEENSLVVAEHPRIYYPTGPLVI